jgi:archaellum biogenesis ATPase FlaH
MKSVLIIGNTGRGKSTSALELLKKAKNEEREIIVYDPNNDYKEFYNKPFLDKKTFLNNLKNKKNSFILFEEATIFFSNKGNEEALVDLLVRKRHTNNEIVLLFHSLRSIPTYILELTNYIILYKTSDRPEYTEQKFKGFDEILDFYNELKNTNDNNKQNFHKHFVIELNKPVHFL